MCAISLPEVQAGGSGNHPQNAARDLARRFKKPLDKWPAPYWAKVPMEDGEVELPFYLPHLYVHKMVSQLEWRLPEDSALLSSLRSLFREQKLQGNPSELIALAVWGDGVPFVKKESLFQVPRGGYQCWVTCIRTPWFSSSLSLGQTL